MITSIKNIKRIFSQNAGNGGGLSGSGTTGKIPLWTPDGFTLGDSIISATNNGIGVNSAVVSGTLATFKGIDTTSSNFVAKFVASDDSVIAAFRNDKKVGINNNAPLTELDVTGSIRGSAGRINDVGIGQYSFWVGMATNEISTYQSATSLPLILQNFGGGNVVIGGTTATSRLQVIGLTTHADNAAAITAGLTAGAMYIRRKHGLDIVV